MNTEQFFFASLTVHLFPRQSLRMVEAGRGVVGGGAECIENGPEQH